MRQDLKRRSSPMTGVVIRMHDMYMFDQPGWFVDLMHRGITTDARYGPWGYRPSGRIRTFVCRPLTR
jgi:hypothetical protein